MGGLSVKKNEDLFAKVLISDQDQWHSFYYLSDLDEDSSQFDDPLFYRVHRAGLDSHLPKLFYVERDDHTKYSILNFVFRGRGSLTYRGETYSVHPGDLYLLPAGLAHAYGSDPKDPIGQIWIEIDGGDSERIIRSVVDQLGPILHDDISNKIGTKMSLLIQQLSMHEHYETSLLVYQIMLDLLYKKNHISEGDESESTSRIQLAKSYIDTHLSDNVSNEHLAEVAGLSPSYFIKLFKEKYRRTPQAYIMQQRIETARHYLSHSDKSVAEIAEQFGFCTTSHFIRRFKKDVGVTPALYRRNAM